MILLMNASSIKYVVWETISTTYFFKDEILLMTCADILILHGSIQCTDTNVGDFSYLSSDSP